MEKIDWLTVLTGACLLAAAVCLAAACVEPKPAAVLAPDPRYGIGLGICLADLRLAKAAMQSSDAGVDKAKLWERFEACAGNNEAVFGFDAGSK